jgi:hypothetical protein
MQQLFPSGGGSQGRPWGWLEAGRRWRLARSAPVQEEEGDGWLGHVGRKARWAGWLLGRLGQKLKEKFFVD